MNYYCSDRCWEPGTDTEDILLRYLPDEITRLGPKTSCVWNGKTQGMPAHTYLLAIACLICHRFPHAAMVCGDITAAQCHEAVEWANEFLAEPIDVPVTADGARLLPRLIASGLSGEDILAAFDRLSLEPDSPEKGEIIRRYISNDEIGRYYQKVLFPENQRESKPSIVTHRLKEYLARGLEFRDLCHMVLTRAEGKEIEVREFLKLLIEMKLHVPMEEKVLTDYGGLATSGGPNGVDTVGSMLLAALFVMGGGRNRNVRAYIPLGEILDTIHEVTGVDGLEQMAAELQEEFEKSDKYEVQRRVYDGEDSYAKREEQEEAEARARRDVFFETYDIAREWQVISFREGNTVEPSLDQKLMGYARQLRSVGESAFQSYVKARDEEGRKRLFRCNEQILIPKEVEDSFFGRIMDDDYIVRYAALYFLELRDSFRWAIRAFLWNPALWEHYWNRSAIPEESEASSQ